MPDGSRGWRPFPWRESNAAARLGITADEYRRRVEAGEKWCTACKAWHDRSAFGLDDSRASGLATRCLASRRVPHETE